MLAINKQANEHIEQARLRHECRIPIWRGTSHPSCRGLSKPAMLRVEKGLMQDLELVRVAKLEC